MGSLFALFEFSIKNAAAKMLLTMLMAIAQIFGMVGSEAFSDLYAFGSKIRQKQPIEATKIPVISKTDILTPHIRRKIAIKRPCRLVKMKA